MRSGGLIDSVQFDQLADLEPQGSPARRGRLAAARQLLSIEALGSIHHEFVLAAFGATQDARVVSTTFTEGSATSEVCAMPIPLDVLRKAVDIRRARMDADWAEVGGLEHPWNCILDRDGPDLPAECQLPEFIAMHQALDGLRTLAEVAYGCGFTLAEAVRLVSILMKRGLVVALGTSSASATALWVPEMFALFSPPASKESTALASGDQEHEPPGLSEGELRAREDVDAGGTHDVEAGRTSGVDLALRQALREELSRTEEHAVSIREQLAQLEHLERLGAVPADA